MKLFRSSDKGFRQRFLRTLNKANSLADVSHVVETVLADVKARGNAAVIEYTKRFDGVALKPSQIRVPEAALAEAVKSLTSKEKQAIRNARRAVIDFHKPTLPKRWRQKNLHGAEVGEDYFPIHRVGIYIPGGAVPLVSSVIMNTVPATMAGVKEIAVFTPPSKDTPNQLPAASLLGALHMCGIREVYRLGGIQAIGAAAFGTQTIPSVEKVFGPGNAYTNEAKRQVFGLVGVDLQPGPSEVMVIADDGANPAYVAADLLAQAEHGTGKEKVFLVTFSEDMATRVQSAIADQLPNLTHREAIRAVLKRHAYAVVVDSLDAAVEVANVVAPEHLELQVKAADLNKLTRGITTAGAILQGYFTPTVLGDFAAGPSHTLPTGRSSRFFSGLRAVDFMRRTSVIRYNRTQLKRAQETVSQFSKMEQLDAHGLSLDLRLEE